jgi:hypothetical protein
VLCDVWAQLPLSRALREGQAVPGQEAEAAMVVGAFVALMAPTAVRASACTRHRAILEQMAVTMATSGNYDRAFHAAATGLLRS